MYNKSSHYEIGDVRLYSAISYLLFFRVALRQERMYMQSKLKTSLRNELNGLYHKCLLQNDDIHNRLVELCHDPQSPNAIQEWSAFAQVVYRVAPGIPRFILFCIWTLFMQLKIP